MCMNRRMKRQNNNTSNNNVTSMERLEGRKGHTNTLSTCWSSTKYTYSSHCESKAVELRGIQVYRAQDLPVKVRPCKHISLRMDVWLAAMPEYAVASWG